MTTFVQIVVNVPAVSGIFDYAIPESLLGKVGVGHLVLSLFGSKTPCQLFWARRFLFSSLLIHEDANPAGMRWF